ncbi:hypothetical protein KUTeg_000631 [Tegillarca granosa]|uniref:Translin n=1 Tax=Tegillarca granosa TaxID=220873 RepID=A0ABQ9FY60_TEGGR|nr:hypothetical protein KUTeg_000631 [Tegillarca granosa]
MASIDTTTTSVNNAFADFQRHLDEEQELKEEIRIIVRDLEQRAREILTHLQQVHQESGIKDVTVICGQAKPGFESVKNKYSELAKKIPDNQYYRFHDHWKFVTQRLSRLAVNCVTAGDYSRPLTIAKFVGELNGGFRLLNLKNDALRKRFDGLKYDLKKVEEIVYDLTIRGLKPTEGNQSS